MIVRVRWCAGCPGFPEGGHAHLPTYAVRRFYGPGGQPHVPGQTPAEADVEIPAAYVDKDGKLQGAQIRETYVEWHAKHGVTDVSSERVA